MFLKYITFSLLNKCTRAIFMWYRSLKDCGFTEWWIIFPLINKKKYDEMIWLVSSTGRCFLVRNDRDHLEYKDVIHYTAMARNYMSLATHLWSSSKIMQKYRGPPTAELHSTVSVPVEQISPDNGRTLLLVFEDNRAHLIYNVGIALFLLLLPHHRTQQEEKQ